MPEVDWILQYDPPCETTDVSQSTTEIEREKKRKKEKKERERERKRELVSQSVRENLNLLRIACCAAC